MWRVFPLIFLALPLISGTQWNQCSAQMSSDAVNGVTCSTTSVTQIVAPASISPGYPVPPTTATCAWLVSGAYGLSVKSFNLGTGGRVQIWRQDTPTGSPTYSWTTSYSSTITTNTGFFYIVYTPGTGSGFEFCVVAPCNAALCDPCLNPPSLAGAPINSTLGNCSVATQFPSQTFCALTCPPGQSGSLTTTCNDGSWSSISNGCADICNDDPITTNALNPVNYGLGTCADSGATSGTRCYLSCTVAGGSAQASCYNGAWTVGPCYDDCQTPPNLLNAYLPGQCTTGARSGQSCTAACNTPLNYTYTTLPVFQCFDGLWGLSAGGCYAPCALSTHPYLQGLFPVSSTVSDWGNANFAFDRDISTVWDPAFSDSYVEARTCSSAYPQAVDQFRFHVPNTANLLNYVGGYFYGRTASNVIVRFFNLSTPPQPGWNTVNLVTSMGGPYWRVGFNTPPTNYCPISELEFLRVTSGLVTTGNCAANLIDGQSCDMACAAVPTGAGYNVVQRGSLTADCNNGQWYDVCGACQQVQWVTGNWSFCSGGVCGAVDRPWEGVGSQTRSVTCVRVQDQVSTGNPYDCDSFVRPDSSQACSQACPATPTILSVRAFQGAIEIEFDYQYWVDPTNATTYDYVEQIVFVSKPGDLVVTYNVLSLPSKRALFYGLSNNVYYTFTAHVVTYYGAISLPSAPSSPPAAPSFTEPCYHNCLNQADCYGGLCRCYPGYWTSQPNVLTQGAARCDMAPRLSIDLFDLRTYGVEGIIDFNYTVNATNAPLTIYVFPESCRGATFCVPIYVDTNVPSVLTIPQIRQIFLYATSPKVKNGQQYFVRLYLSPNFFTDSDSFIINDLTCTGIDCNGHGTCYNGLCECDEMYVGSQFCDVARDPCDLAGLQCSRYGSCLNSRCVCDPAYGYSGDQCQYPPGCGLRCAHGGVLWAEPNDPSGIGCDRCSCPGYWEGRDCSTCGLRCANGGSRNSDCTECNCPAWWTGPKCDRQYISATYLMTIDATPNTGSVNLRDADQKSLLIAFIQKEITFGLTPDDASITIVHDVVQKGNQIEVEVWFILGSQTNPGYTGDLRVAARSNLQSQVEDSKSRYHLTYSGDRAVTYSFQARNPPRDEAAKGSAVSIFGSSLTLLLVLISSLFFTV